jgi:serine/alanine adding enzyme
VNHCTLEVLSTHGQDRERWSQYIAALPPEKKDIYFLPEYAAMYESEFHEPAFLFRYGDDQQSAFLVAVKRGIGELPFYQSQSSAPSAHYYDLATPYGFGGPVVCTPDGDESQLFNAFRESLHQYCLENGIVSEFLRLHPVMQNQGYFGADPGLREKNCTVWIDLRYPEEALLQRMRNDPRRSIKFSLQQGVEAIKSDLQPSHIEEFHRLYTASMKRLNALPMYFFSLEYFQELVANLGDHVALFIATWQDKVISAYLYLHCGRYVDLYLAGSDPEHWDLKANALCIYRAAQWAKTQGYWYCHLGGGHAAEFDSLFHFKSQFSPERAPFFMYRHIHDSKVYAKLCAMKQEFDDRKIAETGIEPGQDALLVDYFPAYRG